jgi:hypothetical protein
VSLSYRRESVILAAKQQPGFKGASLLTDQSANKGMTIMLRETEADLKANEISGCYQQPLSKIASLVSVPPVREAYEVSAQEEALRGVL